MMQVTMGFGKTAVILGLEACSKLPRHSASVESLSHWTMHLMMAMNGCLRTLMPPSPLFLFTISQWRTKALNARGNFVIWISH